uniref:Extended FMRFamide-1 n=1 Tax=Tyrannophasma gladiator TaxID=270861 RepID=FAR1_TYRGL|nr:RecName: Full=Extended FMRFamide-1; Short=FMRFa-1 [Tyrannophasma gladiator]
AQSFVRL